MVRDAGFEPPPASLREALRAGATSTKAAFEIGSAKSSFELFFPRNRRRLRKTRFIINQFHRQPNACGRHFPILVCPHSCPQVVSEPDIQFPVGASQHIGVVEIHGWLWLDGLPAKLREALLDGARCRVRTCDPCRVKAMLYH